MSDPDSIKTLIKNKTMTIHDRDSQGRDILILASAYGCIELVCAEISYNLWDVYCNDH